MDRVRESGVEYHHQARPAGRQAGAVSLSAWSGDLRVDERHGALAFERPFDPIEGDYDIDGE